MELLNSLIEGTRPLIAVQPLLLIVLGIVSGILGGAMPGISPSMAVALYLPFTFAMPPSLALVFLCAIYVSSNYGGSITAITINTPGTASAVVTSFDGYPLTLKGKAGTALGVSLVSSVMGGLVGAVILIIFALPLSRIALNFWPSEYFALAILGLTTVATLGGSNWKKASITVLFGLLLNTVGLDPITGVSRYTFGVIRLFDGFTFVPALIGLFALSEVFTQIELYKFKKEKSTDEKIDFIWPSIVDYWKLKWTMLRSAVIGTVIGILPGAGGTIASFISYDIEKRISKNPESFGKGSKQGVAAAEASNSSSVGGALVPLLTLGIPGSATTAVLIGALMIHDLQPGPELFVKSPEVVYGIFGSLFITNFLLLFIGLLGSRLWVKVTLIPKNILYPVIFVFSIVGSFSVKYSTFDIWTCLAFGVIGWVLKRYKFPLAPIVLGLVLGRMAEMNFRQAVMFGGYSIFFQRPLTLILLFISLLSILYPIYQSRKSKKEENVS